MQYTFNNQQFTGFQGFNQQIKVQKIFTYWSASESKWIPTDLSNIKENTLIRIQENNNLLINVATGQDFWTTTGDSYLRKDTEGVNNGNDYWCVNLK